MNFRTSTPGDARVGGGTGPDSLQGAELRAGQTAELTVYGERFSGRLTSFQDGELEAVLPGVAQAQVLRAAVSHGTVIVSVEGGALSAPVSCWPAGDRVRMRIVGAVEFVQRRLHARTELDVAIVLTWPAEHGSGTERVVGRTADISFGGLRVQPAKTVWPSPGVPVQLMVDFADGALQIQAEVVGKTPDYGLRLRFIDTDPRVISRIAAQAGGSVPSPRTS